MNQKFLCETCCNSPRTEKYVSGIGYISVCKQGLGGIRTKCELYNIPPNPLHYLAKSIKRNDK